MKLFSTFLVLAAGNAISVDSADGPLGLAMAMAASNVDERGNSMDKFSLSSAFDTVKEIPKEKGKDKNKVEPEKGKPISSVDPNSLQRVDKVFDNISQWVKDYAGKYKKKKKLNSIAQRLKNRFVQVLAIETCRKPDQEYRSNAVSMDEDFGFIEDFEEDMMNARGGPDTPQAKAAKYAKVLKKIRGEYLGECKKASKLIVRIDRVEIAMLDALLKMKSITEKQAEKFGNKSAKQEKKMQRKLAKAERRGNPISTMSPNTIPDETTITAYETFHFV